jgi:heat-inducible transcriptional repressor
MDQELNHRTIEVLHSIVHSYIESGEPVPSRSISKQRRDHLSPATIRNVMADLADLGYLDQPHTSAGRVPTEKAFRHYAEALAASRLALHEPARYREELVNCDTLEERIAHTTHILTTMSRNVGIVAAIPALSQQLDQIEIVPLPDRRVLLVVMMRDRMVRNQVVKLDEPMSPEDLASIRNYINQNFSGWVLARIRAELQQRMAAESAAYEGLLKKLEQLYNKGLLEVGLEPQVYMEGASNLVGLDLQLTKEKLQELFRTLEEKKRVLFLLDQFLEGASGAVQVRVGLGEAHSSMHALSLIGINVTLPGGLEARLAVLGPMRMNYARVISTVAQLGMAFRTMPQ